MKKKKKLKSISFLTNQSFAHFCLLACSIVVTKSCMHTLILFEIIEFVLRFNYVLITIANKILTI